MNKWIAGMTSVAAFTAVSAVTSMSAFASTNSYTVRPGDSLWKIAQTTGVSESTITSLNHITNPNTIYVGEVLNLNSSAPMKTYKVQSGDSLWKIGQKFGLTVQDLIAHNNIPDANMIYVGQTLTIPEANQSTSSSSVTGADIAATAKKYLGVPYVWGGTSPSGFDCSGFTQYVYEQNGISMPRNSKAQYGVGTPVAKRSLQPGDEVFFSGTYRQGISHTGIYIGGNKFIEESSGRGKAVIASLGNVYWNAHYTGARRDY